MTDTPGKPRLVARFVGLLLPLGILAVILVAVGTVGMVQFSSSPSFCKSCHNMQPYYDSWAISSHKNVACIQCHIAPGVKAEAMGKLAALNQLVKYVTGTYGLRPWAEVDDASCLRSGCHTERKVEGLVDFNGVMFDHSKHLGELRRGKQLRCTSCHSQIVQGQHLVVTATTCYLCHFKDRPNGDPVAGCTGCHPSPPRVVSSEGYVVDHPQYVADRISCISCHSTVTQGSGNADPSMCAACHNEPERLNKFDDTELMHRVHITDHKVECTRCHTPIEHRIIKVESTFDLDCRSCHSQSHDAQRRLYAGIGGHNVPDDPSKMFLARVTCLGCHEKAATLRGHEKVQVAGEPSCLSCHGIRYANMLPTWQRGMTDRLAKVTPVVAGARAALDAAGAARRPMADSLLRMAQENVDLVNIGKGAHNIAYSDQLLRAALSLVRQAVRAGGLSYRVPAVDLGPPVTEGACLTCHLGVERTTVPFRGGGQFSHERHVITGGLACASCHTSLDQHGGTTITSKEACQACHHRPDRTDCATCHRGMRTR